MSKRPVAVRVLEVLDKVREGEPHAVRHIRRTYKVSERVARAVNQVLRGELPREMVEREARGDLPVGALCRVVYNREGAHTKEAQVDGEGPKENGSHTPLANGRHLFEWVSASGLPRTVVLAEEELREMIRSYVDRAQGGMGQTMQQVAVQHRLTRRDFHKIKSLYGLTKQHEPFTLEEMAERDVSDLADEQLALKRYQLAKRVEQEDIAQIKRAAGKWLTLKQGLLDPFRDILEEVLGRAPAPKKPEQRAQGEQGYICFYQASDLHFGLLVDDAFSSSGQSYNRGIAADRFHAGLEETVEHGIRAFGAPDYVLLAVGGDIAHVDNVHGATTSMRHHQDMDGIPHTIPKELTDIYLQAIDGLLSRGLAVFLECIPGNHDELISRALMAVCWAAYKEDPRVSFGNFTSSHAFHVYGRTALVGHHGHGEKSAVDLASTLDGWLRDHDLSAKHRYALTGNLHHLQVHEHAGLTLIQQPSPAASDVWHTTNGYDTSREATLGAYFSGEEGLLALRYISFS